MMKSFNDGKLFEDGLWPIHLKPQSDELLSSWIVRLAHAHGYKVQTFCHLLFQDDISIGARDIDVVVPATVKEKLSVTTGLAVNQIERATFSDYEGRISETIRKTGNRRWILSQGLRARKPGRYGLMCCPLCLKEDVTPYFRRNWRLAFVTMCVKHGTYMIDRCPFCKAVISPFRSDIKEKGIYPTKYLIRHCWRCGYDLSNAPVEKVSDKNYIKLQESMEVALRDGWINFPGYSSLYSILYFKGIKQLLSGVSKAESIRRLKKCSEIDCSEKEFNWKTEIEHADINQRTHAMKILSKILENWPHKFKDIVRKYDIRHSELKGERQILPYWYEKVLNEINGKGNSIFNKNEKESAINFVIRKKGNYKFSDMRSISGKDLSRYRKGKNRKCGADIYDEVMVEIDHMIASTINKDERLCLIRDKIMFGCGWVLNLTLQELSDMKIPKIDKEEISNAIFFMNAKDRETIEDWVLWYVRNIRPLLMPKAECNSVFTSMTGKRSLKRSAISARFWHIIKVGKLQHSIASYRNWVF